MENFVLEYNVQVDRHRHDEKSVFADHIKWSSRLKECLARGQYAVFNESKIRSAIYRPYTKRFVFFDDVVNQRTFQWPKITGPVVCVTDIGSEKPFMVLMCDAIADLHLVGAGSGTKCFPLSHIKESAIEQFRKHYCKNSITKEDIFHYIYALLHHPGYRERYCTNLKRELPRIPFAPEFTAFATAGKELARLHLHYESLDPWPLQEIETTGVAYSQRVEKMKLSADKQSLQINQSLKLGGIPPQVFGCRLGSRSALEWVIDQYQVKDKSDPNREDDSGYIVRLVCQVVRVSIATVQIVASLPNYQ